MAGTRLALAALLLLGGPLPVFGDPPRALPCPLLDERGAPSPRPALLRIWGGHVTPPDPPKNPRDPPERIFDVSDPFGALEGFWGSPGSPPRCELSPTAPLTSSPKCPQGGGRGWWLLSLGTGDREGTALLEGEGSRLEVSLSLSSLSPSLRALVGSPQTLHCSMTPADPGPFSLEWLRLRGGAPRRLLAFDSRRNRVTHGDPGALLLLGGSPGATEGDGQPAGGALALSLQLAPLALSDGGSFVCSVSTARGQLRLGLRLEVMAPPQVSLSPPSLSQSVPVDLQCHAAGFSPLDVRFRWERRARGQPRGVSLSPGDSWSSGHRRGADGTYSRSAGVRVTPAAGDSYSCLVTHPALAQPVRVTVTVADAIEPSVEDMAGMALVAFVIGGLCLRLWPPAGR